MDCDPIEFSGHALRRMFERRIERDAVLAAVRHGEVIASYPGDAPYPSFLILGTVDGKPLHVLVGVEPQSNKARVTAVYIPEANLWDNDFRIRRMP